MSDSQMTYGKITHDIIRPLFKPTVLWAGALFVSVSLVGLGGYCWAIQLEQGMGVGGFNPPVMWGLYITTFVFWIGIGHAGTLISAILFLFRARWRTGVYRASEAMTIFAVMTAGLFPILHAGRCWYAYWLMPYPNQRELWPNFKSPLVWDVFAISTYLTISAVFFFIGLIPDIASLRDKTQGMVKKIYAALALGWRGTDVQWRHYMAAYGFFAALATPLVVSVHSVVSWDFAMADTPGWHSTIFPPYFVAGAIFSGCAMVLTLLIPMRKLFKWEEYLTMWHFEALARLCLLTGGILTYAYGMEYLIAWYSDNPYEWGTFYWRPTGEYAWVFWTMFICNCVIPLVWWNKKFRTSLKWLFIVSLFINVGMWFERFNIIATSLAHMFDPAAWVYYLPSRIEMGILAGSFGWFMMWFLLFSKVMPQLAISEIKEGVRPPLKADEEAA
jgi:molybdopterin-containing oxidoreductase family membrane subunit